MVRVKVAKGRVVKDRAGRKISGQIEVNERDLFWAALIRSRDVVVQPEKKS
ncbi:MAG: hypothetical protein ABF856_05055 [Acetobacter aceti]